MCNTRSARRSTHGMCLFAVLVLVFFTSCVGGGKDPFYTLKVEVEGKGSVNLSGAGSKIAANTVVTLEVKPEEGWSFVFWAGDDGADVVPHATIPGNYQVVMSGIRRSKLFSDGPWHMTRN